MLTLLAVMAVLFVVACIIGALYVLIAVLPVVGCIIAIMVLLAMIDYLIIRHGFRKIVRKLSKK